MGVAMKEKEFLATVFNKQIILTEAAQKMVDRKETKLYTELFQLLRDDVYFIQALEAWASVARTREPRLGYEQDVLKELRRVITAGGSFALHRINDADHFMDLLMVVVKFGHDICVDQPTDSRSVLADTVIETIEGMLSVRVQNDRQ